MDDDEILHVTRRGDWEAARAAGVYTRSTRGQSLDEVGFVHGCSAEQLDGVLERFWTGEHEPLVVLVISRRALAAHDIEVRDETVSTPDGVETFAHIYGPIAPDVVVAVRELPARADASPRSGAAAAPSAPDAAT